MTHPSSTKSAIPCRRDTDFTTQGYEQLELSTQILIKEALHRQLQVEVLDAQESFIKLQKGAKTEYVRQATRTRLDTYIAPLIMENKLVTKTILTKAGFKVPKGSAYQTKEQALSDFSAYVHQDIVIKPKSTNFGLGVAILSAGFSTQYFQEAVERAFLHDHTVLIEEYIHGREFRYLVLGNQVNGILHRIPANVTGDGTLTIKQLVINKNKDPLRGKGYTTPLEKIGLTKLEEEFLATQGKTFSTIPEQGETVYLRKNSNISTGGDSIDYTDEIHPAYRQLAIEATQAVGAVLCGADLIIQDITQPPGPGNHALIELNFNPAIHIHCYPYKGTNRHPEKYILDMLGF